MSPGDTSSQPVVMEQAPAEVVEFDKLPEWKKKAQERKDAKKAEREAKIQARLAELQKQHMEQYNKRRERLLAKGVKPEMVDAILQQQDFESLPVDKRVNLMARNLNNLLGQVFRDIDALKHNDTVLADSMDLNFRAMAKCLEKAGVAPEDQKAIIEETQKELEAEIKARMEAEAEAIKAQAAAQAKAQEESEKAKIEAEAQEHAAKSIVADSQPEQGAPEFPEAAQVFGGTSDEG